MMSRLRRSAGIRSDQGGMSLAELMVAVALFGLLSLMVVGLFSNFNRLFNVTRAATDSANVAAVGMNEVTRVIRAGTEIRVQNLPNLPVFVAAGTESVTLYAYLDTDSLNPAPQKIQLSIDANRQLVETRWPSTKSNGFFSFPAVAPTSVRTVARQIMTPAADEKSLFTYLLADGTPLVVPASGTFTTEQFKSIASVQVTLKVQADVTSRAAPVTLQNSVGIPNLGVSRVIGS